MDLVRVEIGVQTQGLYETALEKKKKERDFVYATQRTLSDILRGP